VGKGAATPLFDHIPDGGVSLSRHSYIPAGTGRRHLHTWELVLTSDLSRI
jgi:hypothetical protein